MAQRMKANIDAPDIASITADGQTVVWLGREDEILGAASVADRPRDSSFAGLAALREAGVGKIVMMTGDRRDVGLRIGAELGFEPHDVYGDLLPWLSGKP